MERQPVHRRYDLRQWLAERLCQYPNVPAYTQVNLGVSHEFTFTDAKPLTLRFDVVNVFDTIYEIRSGSGIGVFAPQFGPRRGYFVRLARKF